MRQKLIRLLLMLIIREQMVKWLIEHLREGGTSYATSK